MPHICRVQRLKHDREERREIEEWKEQRGLKEGSLGVSSRLKFRRRRRIRRK